MILFGTLNNKVSSLSVVNIFVQRNILDHMNQTIQRHEKVVKINFIVPHLYLVRSIWNAWFQCILNGDNKKKTFSITTSMRISSNRLHDCNKTLHNDGEKEGKNGT